MITQPNQQQQQQSVGSQLPMASQVQIRQSLSLKQIDQNTQQLLTANQPLSPTNTAIQAANKQQQNEQKQLNNGKQTEIKGIPNLVGLTSIDYTIDDQSIITIQDIKGQYDSNYYYLNQLYDEKAQDFPFRMLQDVQNPNDNYSLIKLRIKLPFNMTLEHVELQLAQQNLELFSKYLKFLRIETINNDQKSENNSNNNQNIINNKQPGFIDKSLQRALSLDKVTNTLSTISQVDFDNGLQKLHLKSGFLDSNKKILELHTCGVSQTINLVFLYNKKCRPSKQTLLEMTEKKKEKMFSKTVNVSEKIKAEILPLLNGSDEDIDELDDEVAMISNKQRQQSEKQKTRKGIAQKQKQQQQDVISTDDIKIEMITNQKNNSQPPKQQQTNNQITQGASSSGNNDENEETRNFNSVPRNYSDPLNKPHLQNTGSYNDMEFNSQYMNEHANLLSNDIAHLNDTSNLQLVSQCDIFNAAEQEIFGEGQSLENEIQKLLQKTISQIKITGFNTNSIPAITNTAFFINNACLMKQKQMLEIANEYDFLSGVLMISFKKLTQAAEVFRKIQVQYLQKLLENQKTQQKINDQNLQKIFMKCAILELLVCESMSQPNQINEKLQSIERMINLYQCKIVQKMTFTPIILHSDDPFSVMKKFLPELLKFTVMCLTHKKEIVRISALKLLEFILETKGCSLDQSMVFILKALLNTYPSQQTLQYQQSLPLQQQQTNNFVMSQTLSLRHSDSFSVHGFTQSIQEFFQYEDIRSQYDQQKQHQQKQLNLDEVSKYTAIKEPTSGFLNALKNAYSHALETYISVLSSISSHILHQLFYEVIIPGIVDKKSLTQNTSDNKAPNDMKMFSIKIAEKIITICQGDLFISKQVLEFFINTVVVKPTVPPASSQNETVMTAIKNLWTSIRTKVFTNYSQRGLKVLIDWLVDKMSQIAQNAQNSLGQPLLTDSSNANQDISKLEVSDEESQQLLQLFDIVSMISVGRKNNEAEANSLIKIKQEYCLELYVLINPLMFWLDFSVEREERFALFKSVYTTIKDVLENLPPKRNDIDLLQIMEPILIRTKEFLKNNSPSLQMLKFLDIVLRDMKQMGYAQDNPEIQRFFLEMFDNFVGYVSYCLHEEVFSVFDKLFVLCSDVMSERVLTKCITVMVDKYTLRNRGHKNSLAIFVKNLLEVNVRQNMRPQIPSNQTLGESDDEDLDDQISIRSKNNYFEIICEFCFFKNKDIFPLSQPPKYRDDFKSAQDLHDMYVDKLQFFIDILSQLTEMHVNLFAKFIQHPDFKPTLLSFLNKGEIALRLKCHEILEIITNYYIQHCPSKAVYGIQSNKEALAINNQKPNQQQQQDVMEVQFINHERLQLSQVVLECIVKSLHQQPNNNVDNDTYNNNNINVNNNNYSNDSYLQFNALILLDFLFQQMLPVPTYQNEMQKERINRNGGGVNSKSKNQDTTAATVGSFDLLNEEINDDTPEFIVTASGYTLMRLDLIFKLWPHVQLALNSPWSNIRSICYGLICSMLKIDVQSLANESLPSNPQIGQQYVLKLKQIVLPMLKSLLSSKESESKAGGLNILGSFCGLSYDFSKVKISKNMDFFKKNSGFISNQLWQLVFELQDDWDITIKEASVVLVQLCAPRNGVKYFDKVKKDQQEKRFNQILQGYGLGLNNGEQSSRMSSARDHMGHLKQLSLASNDGNGDTLMQNIYQQDKKTTINQLQDIASSSGMGYDQMLSNSQIFDKIGDTINSNAGLNRIISPLALSDLNDEVKDQTLDEEIKKFERTEFSNQMKQQQQPHLEDPFEFFVDKYQDDQIQEIISIFRNDFKPPKSLWIEKSNQTGINQPDYYAEIYSQAIEQFNQQQAQLQQQQQQQQQQMVNNSPKNSNRNLANGVMGGMVDALEDDLVKKIENERKEKEKQQSNINANTTASTTDKDQQMKAGVDNYKIFERHYEDEKDESQSNNQQQNPPMQLTSTNLSDTNIDAEPFCQYHYNSPIKPINSLENQSVPNTTSSVNNSKPAKKNTKKTQKEDKKKAVQQIQTSMTTDSVFLPQEQTKYSPPAIISTSNNQAFQDTQISNTQSQETNHLKQRKKSAGREKEKDTYMKKTTDELIEEYERKISKTKQKLEEEKRKTKTQNAISDNLYESNDLRMVEAAVKSTPEFKQHKKGELIGKDKGFILQDDSNISNGNIPMQNKSNEKKKNHGNTTNQQQQQQQQYFTELPKSYMSNLDNAKLMKQINNCFNDNSYNNINIGPVVMNTTIANAVGSTKHKQKLNKSFENILASNKYNLKHNDQLKSQKQKNLSTSPRRGSSSGKKSGNAKSASGNLNNNSKKKYLDQSYQLNSKNQQKALQNMRDFNYFIKTIEKDQNDKHKLNLKDFNSMPTTPTSILKKVEDQMKALASQNLDKFSKFDIKAQMSNTCPNMAQILSQLDTFAMPGNGLNNPQIKQSNNNQGVLQISSLKMNGLSNQYAGGSQTSEAFITSNHTPSSISNNGNLIMAQSQNTLSGNSLGNNLDKFTFSKTQKLDLKEATKNLFHQPIPLREGQTARDHSNENKKSKYTSNLNVQNGNSNNTKRSRGSQEKYLTNNPGAQQLMNHSSGSSSFTKLNKSLNNISQITAPNNKKKETLSRSMINNFVLATNMSPKDKKLVQQMIKAQLGGNPSQVTTNIHQTPNTGISSNQQQNLNNQYSYSSNLLYDYIQGSEQSKKQQYIHHPSNTNNQNQVHQLNSVSTNQQQKTPVKNQNNQNNIHAKKQGVTGKIGNSKNYSEIFDISPNSGEKDKRSYAKYIL